MKIRHILAATDASRAGNHAVRVALLLGETVGAEVTPLMVRFALFPALAPAPGPAAPAGSGGLPVGTTVVDGIPAIEIVRFAEREGMDLIVMSRTLRDEAQGTSLGDTCDAVIRRAEIPCLVIPPVQGRLARIRAALDGSERGMAVLRTAWEFQSQVPGNLSGVYVEPAACGQDGMHSAQADRLPEAMRAVLPPGADVPLLVRQGERCAEVLADLSAEGGDLLVVGVRRGGPADISESTGIGRLLMAAAPCAVLTVPL